MPPRRSENLAGPHGVRGIVSLQVWGLGSLAGVDACANILHAAHLLSVCLEVHSLCQMKPWSQANLGLK